MIDINKFLDFLLNEGITDRMYITLSLMKANNKETLQAYSKLNKQFSDSLLTPQELKHLVDNKYLIKNTETGKFSVGAKFNRMFLNKFVIAEELWNAYPSYVSNSDKSKQFPLKIADISMFREMYMESIKGIEHEHVEVLLDVEYAVTNNLGLPKIMTFVQNKHWEQIRDIRNNVDNNQSDNQLTTIFDDDDY